MSPSAAGRAGGAGGIAARTSPGRTRDSTGSDSTPPRYRAIQSISRRPWSRNSSRSMSPSWCAVTWGQRRGASASLLFHVGDDEHQYVRADAELHLVAEHLLLDALEVDEGAVGGVEVAQDGRLAQHLQDGVLARGLGVV